MRSTHVPETVSTQQKVEIINLTHRIEAALATSGVRDGFVHLQSLHTTAGLLVNEYQAALLDDMLGFLDQFVDEGPAYRHNDPRYSDCDRGNATSHLRSLLLNPTLVLPVSDGRLVLGRYQRILFTELDGPRERTVSMRFVETSVATAAAPARRTAAVA